MKKSYKDLNEQFEDINEALKNIYENLSPKNKDKAKEKSPLSFWERLFPGVLLVKTMEDINCQLNDILHITNMLSQEIDNTSIEEKLEGEEASQITDPFSEEYKKSLENTEKLEKNAAQDAVQKEEEIKKEPIDEEPSKLAMDIIRLRDQLLLAKCSADEGNLRIIENLYKETGRILGQHGIEPIEEAEEFNSQYQTIVDNKITNDIELKNKVAENFKPGYRLGSRILRAQEVVLYKYKEEEN